MRWRRRRDLRDEAQEGSTLSGTEDRSDAAENPDAPTSADAPHDTLELDGTRTRRQWSGTRLVALIAIVALVSLVAGVVVMQFIVSPAEIAARTAAPDSGPVTAPVEKRTIENTVVSRGEVTYADAIEVKIASSGSENRAVITGQVPEVGTVLNPGNIALEVSGRPVIVLPGELPSYRSLSIGMRGPDVLQLKAALTALGYGVGDAGSDTFDYDTASAVGALYGQIGYEPSTGGQETQTSLRTAQRGARDANVALAQAQATLNEAVRTGAPSVISEQAAVNAASDQVVDAQATLAKAQEAVLPTLPSSEVLFLANLPRRVDSVAVKRGDLLAGSPMNVSGATLTVTGTVSKQDAELLTPGLTATFPVPGGDELTATVSKVTAPKKGGSTPQPGGDPSASSDASSGQGNSAPGSANKSGDRYTVELTPGELTPQQIDALRDQNVRLRIPVASTKGEVLAVPIAALSTGSGGEDRVELLIKNGRGDDAKTETITVEAGLAADGFVEIKSDDPRIKPGAKVVVGR